MVPDYIAKYEAAELEFERQRSRLIFKIINDLTQLDTSQEDFTDLTFIARIRERTDELATFCGHAKPLLDYCLFARLSLPDEKSLTGDKLLAQEHDLSLNAIATANVSGASSSQYVQRLKLNCPTNIKGVIPDESEPKA